MMANENAPGRPQGARLIVIDTDPGVRWALERGLSHSGYTVRSAARIGEALHLFHEHGADAVVMEMLPEAGLTLDSLSAITDGPSPPPVICVSIDARPKAIIECMRQGAVDYLVKPFSLAELRGAVARALEATASADGRRAALAASDEDASALVGVSQAIKDLRRVVQQAAMTNLNCLIRGRSGVGKDVVAREIHRLSARHTKPFIKVNCSALPENLLESELFGYEKGAFTGADTSKPGRFSLANTGVIFLDEIGDMHPFVQAKILQVIEHKEFTKLGGGSPVHVDVQIIAATNANLEEKIAAGAFRDDLFFRLNEVYIWAPPLNERPEDVPLLVGHFLRKHAESSPGNVVEFSDRDLETLCAYEWPGNIRELESTVKRCLALGKVILPASSIAPVKPPAAPKKEKSAPPPGPERIIEVLERDKWNRRKAADDLGISYSALRRYIEKFGLDRRV